MDPRTTPRARARAAGALVCRLPVNLGQGQAFRLGYRLARDRGATLIATVDADGQFDPGELPALVAPLVAGEADFVNGSRRLGRTENTDPVRNLGVVVFGALVSVLTGVRITDPANGLRAFRAEVTARVPLRQTQYQTAELLIGAVGPGLSDQGGPGDRCTAAGPAPPRRAAISPTGPASPGSSFTTWWSGPARKTTRSYSAKLRGAKNSPDTAR